MNDLFQGHNVGPGECSCGARRDRQATAGHSGGDVDCHHNFGPAPVQRFDSTSRTVSLVLDPSKVGATEFPRQSSGPPPPNSRAGRRARGKKGAGWKRGRGQNW